VDEADCLHTCSTEIKNMWRYIPLLFHTSSCHVNFAVAVFVCVVKDTSEKYSGKGIGVWASEYKGKVMSVIIILIKMLLVTHLVST
jgi:hypothetical protein